MSYPVQFDIIELTQEIIVSDPPVQELIETKENELHIPTLEIDGKNMIMIGPERPNIEINRQFFSDMRVTYIPNDEVLGLLSHYIPSNELPTNSTEQYIWLGLILLSRYGGVFGLTTLQFKSHIRDFITNDNKMSILLMSLPGLPRHICPFIYYSPVPHPFFQQFLDDMRKDKISLINPYSNTLQWFLQRRGVCNIIECHNINNLPFIMNI